MELIGNLGFYAEILAGIFTIFFYQKYKYLLFYKYFLMYILVVLLFECAWEITRLYNYPIPVLLDVYTFLEFNIVALIYYHLTKEKVSHKWIINLVVLFNSIFFLSFFISIIQNYIVVLLAIILSLFMVFYLKELLKSEKVIAFQRELSFWITIAFLFYYLTTIPFYTVLEIITIERREDKLLLYLLQSIINTITYLCFVNGLIWGRKQQK